MIYFYIELEFTLVFFRILTGSSEAEADEARSQQKKRHTHPDLETTGRIVNLYILCGRRKENSA